MTHLSLYHFVVGIGQLQESCLYPRLNAALRNHDKDSLEPFLPYMKLLLSALYQLPLVQVPTYRGIKLELFEVSDNAALLILQVNCILISIANPKCDKIPQRSTRAMCSARAHTQTHPHTHTHTHTHCAPDRRLTIS